MTLKNKLFLLLLSPVILWAVWNQILGRAGFCAETWRFASDEDLIYFALGYAESEIEKDFDGQSLKDYQEKHKNCCSVSYGRKGIFSLLFGDDFYDVELTYKRKPQRVLDVGCDYYVEYIEINSCGRRGEIYGEDVKLENDSRALNFLKP